MRFLLDHDVPAEIGRVLTQAGHETHRVMDVLSPTVPDETVFDHAVLHELFLITSNRDDVNIR